jgi:hypothetical protein
MRGAVLEDVGRQGAEQDHGGDLQEAADEHVRQTEVALEVGVLELAQPGAPTVKLLGLVGLHPLAPRTDLSADTPGRGRFVIGAPR